MILRMKAKTSLAAQKRNISIMCVDDSKVNLLANAYILASHGYDVIATDDAEQALHVLRETTVAAVVTDYEMPRMNGARFVAHLRSAEATCRVLLHSGRTELPSILLARVDGCSPKGQSVVRFLQDVDAIVAGKSVYVH